MGELSIFVDESGELGPRSKYYLITLLFHSQDESLATHFAKYERVLSDCRMPDIPFHLSPLLNGHDDYEGLSPGDRKRYLSKFLVFSQALPFAYHTFAYRKSDFSSSGKMIQRMRRDMTSFLFDHLEFLQSFDSVKIYYDDGQQAVTNTLHDAIQYVVAKDAVLFKSAEPRAYRLSQVADFVCGIELTAIKYGTREQTATDERFFGGSNAFKKNYLRKLRKKRIR